MTQFFNFGLLRMARQSRGMSQAELSKASGLSQANISKYENGTIETPPQEALQKIANAVSYPCELFFAPDNIVGLPISVQYRKKASISLKAKSKLEAKINFQLLHVRRLLRVAETEAELQLPEMDVAEYGSPAAIASLLRRTWHQPSGPIRNLVSLVERAGCIVVYTDLSDLAVDGFTSNVPGTPPCIFVNKAQPADRQRFTIAHELGHIIMHKVPSPDMEDEANNFASAFLLPPDELKPLLSRKLNLAKLAALKPIWKVSMAALLVCANSCGAITPNQSRYLWMQMSKYGYRRKEPSELDFPAEVPTALRDILSMHTEELGYSIQQIADLLYLKEAELRQNYPVAEEKVHASGLRLVPN
ncbi:MAG: XRE family transcriptional regulator [Kordiimonadaceae bacterium]|nr:XRE family transcriptional regulator [Kordiimonadaceae bacterium]